MAVNWMEIFFPSGWIKSPLIVLADADLNAAVEGTLKAIFTNAGQVCSAGSRLIVERSVHGAMLERLATEASRLTAGHGLTDAPIGPIVSPVQLARITAMVDAAKSRGVSLVTGGVAIHPPRFEGGWYYAPTILDGVPPDDPAAQEEIFGPVLTVLPVDSAEEALTVANGTAFGLVAGIYTRDITRALRLARDVGAGQVYINQYFAGGVETPFGGVGMSGFGREKGLEGVKAYYRVKCITARI